MQRVLDIQCELKWHINPSAKVPVYAAIICGQHLFHSGIYYFWIACRYNPNGLFPINQCSYIVLTKLVLTTDAIW